MYQHSFFAQSLRSNGSYGSFRQKSKETNSENKKTDTVPSRRNSIDNRTSILRRSFRQSVSRNNSDCSLDAKDNIQKSIKLQDNTKKSNLKAPALKKNQSNSKNIQKEGCCKLPKLYRSKSLDFSKITPLDDLTKTASCSSFFVSKSTDVFLKNFHKNMSILKAGLLTDISTITPSKSTSKKAEDTFKIDYETDFPNSDAVSVKSDSLSSESNSIGNRLHQRTTRSYAARHSEGFGEVSFERSLRSSKKINVPTLTHRVPCPKENAVAKPRPKNAKKQRRKSLKKMINDGFLEKLKSRSELRLDFVKEKRYFVGGCGFQKIEKSPVDSKINSKKRSDICGNISDDSSKFSDFGSKNKSFKTNYSLKNKTYSESKPGILKKSIVPNCDSKSQKDFGKNFKARTAKYVSKTSYNNPVSYQEIFERSMHRKHNFSNTKDSYFKSLNLILNKNILQQEAKTDEQITKEKQWLDTQKVWLMHRGGFALAKKVSGQETEPGKVKMQLEQTGDYLIVDEDDIEKANPSHFDKLEDLTNLRYLNESSILHTLRQRYASNLIHTNAGSNTLLVVNPMAPLAVYSEKVVALFKGCKSEDMPPHIYSIAQSAYHNMLSTRKDQSILFLGRSGSGKTTNFRHSLQYLLTAAGSVNKVLSVEKLSSIWTVLESFGNCKTVMNTNATRFTQIFSLDFDQSGVIASASIQILMLEKTRICKKLEGESSFHIMQRLLFGVEGNLRKELFLDHITGNESNVFFNLHQKHEDKQRMQIEFGKICSSMTALGIGEQEQKVLWCILAALYHLGNAGASKVGNSSRYQFANPQPAQKASILLGTTVEELSRVIFGSSSGGMVTPNAPRQPFRTPSPTDRGLERDISGLEALEGLVVGLYSEVFNAVASMINKSISASTHTVASLLIVDTPGFQNPATCGRQTGASFEDLCHNYLQERLQLLYHHTNLVAPKDRYLQENIEIELDEHEHENLINPTPLVNLLDRTAQNTVVRTSQNDLHEADRRGLLWLLDEEAIYPGSNDESFLERLFTHYGDRDHQLLLRKAPGNHQFILQHLQGTNPVLYNCSGWLKCSRENPIGRSGVAILQESHREDINKLFVVARGLGASSYSGSLVGIEGSQSLRRASSIRRTFTAGTAAIKRKSICLQTKFTVDGLVETLRRTKLRFVQCILPQHNAGLCEINSPLLSIKPSSLNDDGILNVPLLRSQIRGGQILDSIRLHKLGFPNFLPLGEFRRRFRLLAPDYKPTTPVLDERKAVEDMLLALDLEMTSYRVGLSQIFFRSGILTQLESQRDEKLAGMVVSLQAHCRGYLARKKLTQRKLQDLAVRCIQRNVRKFLLVRDWPWWRLLVRVTPLLNVHRTEEELKSKTEELEVLKAKLEKLESERITLKHHNDKLEAKLSEMTADLAEEHSTSTLAAERLDAETAERIKLERDLNEVQQKNKDLQNASERLEMELLYARSELNGISEDDEDGDGEAIYKQRYERAMRELEFTKRRLQQQHEDDLEQLVGLKKQLEKKLTDAYEEVEEQRQVVGQWKRKVQKLNGEMNDLKLLLEEQSGRNNLLEKKQRKFDSELQLLQDELKKEKQAKERLSREKEVVIAEKYTLESNVADLRLEVDLKEEKLTSLQGELDELTYGGKTEEEVTVLRKQKIDCDRRLQDQEEELDELAGQVQLLEQAKLKLEMNLEQQRKASKKEAQQHDEELEEVRCNAQKKVKALEIQLENEHEERTILLREKHELERRLTAALENDRNEKACDEAVLQRLKRDLKRTKALLRDTQAQLERQKAENPSKAVIRQLKNQIEDLECARSAAVKTKQILEADLSETQAVLEETVRQKNELEEKTNSITREKADLQLQVEENEEELAEVLKKYKITIQQMSLDQLALQEQVALVGELEAERNNLKEQLVELTSKLDSLENMGDASSNVLVRRSELKIKELESKLDLEQTTRSRLEVQISRLKETMEKLQHDLVTSRTKEQNAQDQIRKLQRSLRELKDEHNSTLTKESESLLKRKELEKRYEALEAESSTVRADLRLALKRIEDLQAVIQNDLEDSTENSDSEHDSYSSDDSVNTFLANHKISSKSNSMQFESQRRLSNTSRSSTSSNLTKDSSYA